MIEVIHGVYYVICDRCEIEAEEEFDSFADTVAKKWQNMILAILTKLLITRQATDGTLNVILLRQMSG